MIAALYRRSGVARRHSILLSPNENAGVDQHFYPPANQPTDRGPTTAHRMNRYATDAAALATGAAQAALDQAGFRAADIQHLVTASCTGFAAPGADITLAQTLGLPPTVSRTHVGFMGCHGAFNALRVAGGLLAPNPGSRALVVAIELCSLHFGYGWNPQQIVANALFADGAAAVACQAGEATSAQWQIAAHGSCMIPNSLDAMTWRIGDHGFEMTLSPRVPDLISAHLRPWASQWLDAQNLKISDIQSWAVHPGGPRILATAATTLGLDPAALDVSHQVLSQCGNMSSPTILFILDRLRRANAPRPAVALGFGPGLTVEGMLLR